MSLERRIAKLEDKIQKKSLSNKPAHLMTDNELMEIIYPANLRIGRSAKDISDDELAAIAAGNM